MVREQADFGMYMHEECTIYCLPNLESMVREQADFDIHARGMHN
jgi:hypothetical protein